MTGVEPVESRVGGLDVSGVLPDDLEEVLQRILQPGKRVRERVTRQVKLVAARLGGGQRPDPERTWP